MTLRNRALGAALLLLVLLPAHGADHAPANDLYPLGSDHDPSVVSPLSALGYRAGEAMTHEAELGAYLDSLIASSDRALLRTYGKTHEGRPLRYLVVTHPDNLARLDRILAGAARLADPRGTSQAELDGILASNPVIVWLAYGVHGNEHSSTEAALALAYHLCAARDPATLALLRSTVVIIDPAQNPDGRARFLQYQLQIAGPEPRTDPWAAEHHEPWPSGRFNHHLFDLNRDWFFQTQPETAGKVRAFLDWMPQVYVDLHEMGSNSTYYFAPPAEPVNHNIPGAMRKWWGIFGEGNATAFDRAGFDYFTQETYDGYYPGYGDSWPTLHGAVGMTYEQATARGMAIERHDGSILTLREATRHHLTASLSTIDTAAAHREELLKDFLHYRRGLMTPDRTRAARAYLIPPTVPSTASRLARLLTSQGIEVLRADVGFSLKAHDYEGGSARVRRFPSGTFIVPVDQPAGRLVNALMEMDPPLSEEFVAQELERQRMQLRSAIYDVTAWSLPIVTGTEAYWASELPRVATSALRADDLVPTGSVESLCEDTAPRECPVYAYLIKYDSNESARALIRLLEMGVRVHATGSRFVMGTETFPSGSLILRAHGAQPNLSHRVEEVARRFGVRVFSVSSGLTDEGIDLGSNRVRALDLPRVAVAYGDPVSPTSVGAILHLFETVYDLPFTPIRSTKLRGVDLSRFDVLILPDAGEDPGYAEYFGKKGLGRLKSWIEGGGTLVTLKHASLFATREATGLSMARRLLAPGKEADGDEDSSEEKTLPDWVPGAILRVAVETERPLAFGYSSRGAVMVNSDLAFAPARKEHAVVSFTRDEDLRLAGFIWADSLELLAGSAYLVEEPRGRGRIILFSDDPNFRGYWESLHRLFLNSVLYAPAFGAEP